MSDLIKWEKIRYLVLDVDGTMTDGGVYLDSQGNEMKKFSIKDGAGILLLRQGGIAPVILTGRESLCVAQRAKELQIPYVFQNVKRKKEFLREFFREHQVSREQAAYIGDDLNDLGAMGLTAVAACPRDAVSEVRKSCSYILKSRGGEGAVREFAEILLKKQGILASCQEALWGQEAKGE
ncbi:MAG TPA: 3-deoxy-D-manno-octulosonate 8-phosphate phosphatase [Candidatus Blautia stercoripullorum]|uniref:3-deoxy-D-manno-octulosonate 8-phosphate phosphatase n=1 Tax=Candidatus Blautia stercoripullorum TaxID=2838502 RepID=A0A9D2U755_9FIRM|nr:3-deoxy-D-manno-octulosonate 8-phosphate phosphatase [Candidatus Blautia stercoripullorum]